MTSLSTKAEHITRLAAATIIARRHIVTPPPRSIAPFPQWLRHNFPDWPWDAQHLLDIQAILEEFTAGNIQKLMIFMPPRFMKSQTVTVRYSAWRLERDPALRVIVAAYGQGLASNFSRQIRHIVRERIPLNPERQAMHEWETTAGGGLRAVGVGSGVTGLGASLIAIDDPVKSREEADSPTFRERAWEWYTDSLYPRRENPDTQLLLIQTRWHRDDLAGRILASKDGPNWHVLSLPAINEEGEALWPERFPLAELASIRASTSDRTWHALYQQAPTSEGGVIVQRDWYEQGRNRYDTMDQALQNAVLRRYISFDTAEEVTDTAAFTACVVGDLMPDYSLHIREVWRGKVSIPELPGVIERLATKHNWDGKLRNVVIEYKSSGKATYQTMKRSAPDWLRPLLFAHNPIGDKVTRLSNAAVWMRQGMVLLPYTAEGAPWLDDYEDELFGAPNSPKLDQVDATSQLVKHLENPLSQGLRLRVQRVEEYAAND